MSNVKTKQKILEEGLGLLGETGFVSLSLGTLATRVGLSKSGLFAHFKSKAELEEQLIGEVNHCFEKFIAPAMSKPKGLRRLNAFFESWIGWTNKANLSGGCPIAAGLFELDDLPPTHPTRAVLQQMTKRAHAILLSLCEDAISSGELRSDLDKEQFIFEMHGIYLSHHVSYRFEQDARADRWAKNSFKRLVQYNQGETKRK